MKKFNFEESLKMGHSPAVVNFLKENQYKKIGLDFYIIAMRQIPKKIGSKARQPSYLKRQYNYLKKEFGFFQ